METARIRIVNVRLKKTELKLVPLDSYTNDLKLTIIQDKVSGVLKVHEEAGLIAGFAFVVWSKDGSSTVDAANLDGNIPSILIPDFVRNRLLASVIEKWTIDTINDR